jgi:S1-C subfamily serine protease
MKRLSPLFLLLVLVLTGLACRVEFGSNTTGTPPATRRPTVTLPSRTQSPLITKLPVSPGPGSSDDALIALYERVAPGVVAIQVLTEAGGGLGSGFVYDTEGHIITNYHVIEGNTDLEVDFPSGLKVRGQVIATDLDSDLAVIKVDVPAEALLPLSLGDSDQLRVGQTVVAIGNPFGLNGTMTVGIISGIGRMLTSLREAPSGQYFSSGGIIQTDAAINPGNSGGPLLNLAGEVIGINRAIRTTNYTDTGEPTNSGIGFAVASNIVRRVVPGLIADGKYDYPYIGISSLDELTLIEQELLGLPQSAGVYVNVITANSPADKAGLRPGTQLTTVQDLLAGGDLIIAINGKPVKSFGEFLYYLISNTSPGDNVTLTVLRGEQEIEVQVTLDKRP